MNSNAALSGIVNTGPCSRLKFYTKKDTVAVVCDEVHTAVLTSLYIDSLLEKGYFIFTALLIMKVPLKADRNFTTMLFSFLCINKTC